MSLISRLFNTARDERLSREIDREMAFHIREHADELMARGISRHDALLAPRRVALLAGLFPALRASRVDPVTALRED